MVCSAHVLTGRVKRFVRRNAADKNDIEAVIDYNSPNKKEARERGLKHLKPGPQKIITLAGTEGYCVKIMLARCPEAEITNIEHDPAILAEWKKKKIPTHDFLGDLHKFLESTAFAKNQYSLFNADLMGYACNTLNADLIRVNEMANVNIIVLTLLNIKKFRNTGHWVQWARKHYHSDDPTREWLVDIMDHYTIIDEWDYIREPEKHSRSMRMFVLRRRKL